MKSSEHPSNLLSLLMMAFDLAGCVRILTPCIINLEDIECIVNSRMSIRSSIGNWVVLAHSVHPIPRDVLIKVALDFHI